jgi:hypothetical protein
LPGFGIKIMLAEHKTVKSERNSIFLIVAQQKNKMQMNFPINHPATQKKKR